MIDDDCEPVPEWLAAMLDTQQRTAAGAVTGTMVRRGSTEEPFLEYDLHHPGDGAQLQLAATFNSMISSRWLKDHPTIRFQPDLGFTSGEDMAFYGAARAAGLKIHYSQRRFVYENEPPSRATFSYQLRAFFWHGNSTYVTSVRNGILPFRMFLRGANSLRKALARPSSPLQGRAPPNAVLPGLGASCKWHYGIRLHHPL